MSGTYFWACRRSRKLVHVRSYFRAAWASRCLFRVGGRPPRRRYFLAAAVDRCPACPRTSRRYTLYVCDCSRDRKWYRAVDRKDATGCPLVRLARPCHWLRDRTRRCTAGTSASRYGLELDRFAGESYYRPEATRETTRMWFLRRMRLRVSWTEKETQWRQSVMKTV